MADQQEPNVRDKLYASSDHEVEYFRGMLEKMLRRSREAMFSDSLENLAGALAKAQAEFSTPKRTKEAMVTATRRYNYADLQDVLASVREPLAKHGLSVTQMTQEFAGQVELVTLLLHSSGEWLRSVYPVKAKTERPQEFGSALTYARRYTLSALLGIASEEDDDAQGAQAAQKDTGSDPAHEAVHKKVAEKARQEPSEPDLELMAEGASIRGRYKFTIMGGRDFLNDLSAACEEDNSYWRLNRGQVERLHKAFPQMTAFNMTLPALLEMADDKFGGVGLVDPDEVDAGKQGPVQAGRVL